MNKNWIFFIVDFETTGLGVKEHYPIEVGGLFTDSNFTVLDIYKSFIKWPELKAEVEKEGEYWPLKYQEAYSVHDITPLVCTRSISIDGIDIRSPVDVAGDLQRLCEKLKKGRKNRVIMISDNAVFEHSFMQKIFESSKIPFPFHFSTWDASMFLELSDTRRLMLPHRAFSDASSLHNALMRARGKLDLF